MMIKNKTRNKILSKNFRLCKNIFLKATGLMFSGRKTLVFVNKEEELTPLHMWFVFFQIDVLYLNKDKAVVELKENFKPFSFYNPKKKAMYVVELPCRVIRKSGTRVGDRIEF